MQVAMIFKMAGLTRIELATSCVTGTHSLLSLISGQPQTLRSPANLAGAQTFYETLIFRIIQTGQYFYRLYSIGGSKSELIFKKCPIRVHQYNAL